MKKVFLLIVSFLFLGLFAAQAQKAGTEEFARGQSAFQAKNYSEAFQWYMQAADKGNLNAMAKIGFMYDSGMGVGQNAEKSFEWNYKAAKGGLPESMALISLQYELGVGVKQSKVRATDWTIRAAEAGDASAMHRLGLKYKNGDGVEQNFFEATKWLQKAVEHEYPWAKDALDELIKSGLARGIGPRAGTPQRKGLMQVSGARQAYIPDYTPQGNVSEWVVGRYNSKYVFLDKAGNIALPQSFELAEAFYEGVALVKLEGKYHYIDSTGKQAIPDSWDMAGNFVDGWAAVGKSDPKYDASKLNDDSWYDDPGHFLWVDGAWGFIDKTGKVVIPIQYSLENTMRFYKDRLHVIKDGKEYYIDKSGKKYPDYKEPVQPGQGIDKTTFDQAMALYDKKQRREAQELFLKAGAKGNSEALYQAAKIEEWYEGIESYPFFLKAAEKGNSKAMGKAANFYEKGFGVEKDIDKAISLYKKAIAMGDAYAMYNLAQLYEEELKDMKLANEWYMKAFDKGDLTVRNALYERWKDGELQ